MKYSAVVMGQHSPVRSAAYAEALERAFGELNTLFELLEAMNWLPRNTDETSALEIQMRKWKAAQRAMFENCLD